MRIGRLNARRRAVIGVVGPECKDESDLQPGVPRPLGRVGEAVPPARPAGAPADLGLTLPFTGPQTSRVDQAAVKAPGHLFRPLEVAGSARGS
jgi:hypothetical protein